MDQGGPSEKSKDIDQGGEGGPSKEPEGSYFQGHGT
jgi:hypothetical protein